MYQQKENNRRSSLYLSHNINICISFTFHSFVLDGYEVFTASDDEHVELVCKIVEDFGYFEESRVETEKTFVDDLNHGFEVIKFLGDIALDVFSTFDFICMCIISCFFLQTFLLNFILYHFIIVLLSIIYQSLQPVRKSYCKEVNRNITDKNFC